MVHFAKKVHSFLVSSYCWIQLEWLRRHWMIPWSEREGANGCSYGSGNRGIIIFVIQLSICGAGSIPAWGIFLFIANAKVQQFVRTVAVTELRGSPEVKRRKARSVLGWGSTQGWPCRSGCTQTGPRRDWLHTGITQTAPGGIGCTREAHRRAPGGIGCTRESHRRAPGGIGCTRELQRGGPGGLVAHRVFICTSKLLRTMQ